MTAIGCKSVDFEKYFRLLHDMLPSTCSFAVCDPLGIVVHASNDWPGAAPGEPVAVPQFPPAAVESQDRCGQLPWPALDADLMWMSLHSRFAETIGYLLLPVTPPATGKQTEQGPALLGDALRAVGACIEKECELTAELDAMASELASRYEELNLIYATNDDLAEQDQEHEALNQLVQNCVEYLDVSMVVLMLPPLRKLFYAVSPRDALTDPFELAQTFQGEFWNWIRATEQPVVINEFADQLRTSLCPHVVHKVLACPVRSGTGEVIGALVTLNQRHRTDFFNSDRNLLDAMARKAAKIIQAGNDSLTGLMMLRSFRPMLNRALKNAREVGIAHGLLLMDIDQLRILNDTHGRPAGDAVLKWTAERLRERLRTTDSLAYLGDGKYGVLLERCPDEQAFRVADQLRQYIHDSDFHWQDNKVPISASVGVVAIEPGTRDADAALEAAELALEAAKEQGRNRAQMFTRDDRQLAERKSQMQWVARIQTALQEQRFQLYAQTILPTRDSDEAFHCEILLRLFEETDEPVAPATFIPAAERYHLMPVIDRWVIGKTFATLAAHGLAQTAGGGTVSINLSGQSLTDDGLGGYITDEAARNGIEPRCVCFEITETAAVANIDLACKLIAELKSLGYRFSLDDFGTGLSSFTYLKNLPVDILKIDGSFVRQIADDPVAHTMVASINDIGHVMNLKTVAEFVENDQLKTLLLALGVDYLQGYGIAAPRRFDDYLASLGLGPAAQRA